MWGTSIKILKVQEDFRDFVSSYCELGEAEPLYMRLLRRVVETQTGFINIDCEHLHSHNPDLYEHLVNYPTEVVPLFDYVIQEFVNEELARRCFVHMTFPPLPTHKQHCFRFRDDVSEGTVPQVQVRTFNLMELKSMRDLNPADLDRLIAVKGMITRSGGVLPDLKEAFFRCGMCAAEIRVQIDRGRIAEPAICENCNSRGTMELIHNRCWFADKQVIKLQETPESIPEGETPVTVNISCYDTLVDAAKPGDRVIVTGIYRASPIRPNPHQRTTQAIYRTCTSLCLLCSPYRFNVIVADVDVLHFKKEETNTLGVADDESNEAEANPWHEASQSSLSQLTPADEEGTTVAAHLENKKRRIQELAKRPDIYDLLARSVCMYIYTHPTRSDTDTVIQRPEYGDSTI